MGFIVGDRVVIIEETKQELADLYVKHKGLAGLSEKDVNKIFVVEGWSGSNIRVHDSNNKKRLHNINKDSLECVSEDRMMQSRDIARNLHEAKRLLEADVYKFDLKVGDGVVDKRSAKVGTVTKVLSNNPNVWQDPQKDATYTDPDVIVTWKDGSKEEVNPRRLAKSTTVKEKVTEAVDFPSAFNKYKKDLFPDYIDLRAFIRATSDEKWTIQDIESAFYTVDSGREIKKDSTSFTKDPDDYFKYIVKVGGKTKELDDEGCFAELLLFAGKNGNPLKFIVDDGGVYQELVKLED